MTRTVVDAGPGAADALAAAFERALAARVPEARAVHEKSPEGFAKAERRLARGEPGGVAVLVPRAGDGALAWVRMAPHTGWPADAWALPGGGVEPGEAFEDAARREVLEETGLTVTLARPVLLLRQAFTCGDARLPEQPFVFYAARTVDADARLAPRLRDVAEAHWFAEPPRGAFDRDLVLRARAALTRDGA